VKISIRIVIVFLFVYVVYIFSVIGGLDLYIEVMKVRYHLRICVCSVWLKLKLESSYWLWWHSYDFFPCA
jgi:hypothetical protein